MKILLKNLIKSKLKTLNELRKIREERGGQIMVLASGCFDLIHANHIEYLAWSKGLGNYLVVAINSDNSVKRLKGVGRPINSLKNRVKLLVVNSFVDYIIPFSELNTIKILRALKPNITSHGNDYVLDKKNISKGRRAMNQKERRCVESYGGEICFSKGTKKLSTTNMIKLIKNKVKSIKN